MLDDSKVDGVPEQGLREPVSTVAPHDPAHTEITKDGRCVVCMVSELTRLYSEVERLRAALERPQDRCPQCGNTPTTGGCALCCSQKYQMERALERPRPARPKPDVPTARELREYSDGLQDGRQLGREEASVGIPRRIQRLTWCDAERQIQDAVDEVERMGADVRLTDAVCLLGAARDRVADFVDGVEGKRIVPGVPSTLPVAGTTCPTCKGPAIETRVPDKELEYWSTWRAALPAEHAPPEPSEAQLIAQFNERAKYNAEWWHVKPTFYDALPAKARAYQLANERAQWGIVMRGAGRGAGHPEGET